MQIKSGNSRTRSESLKKVLDYIDDERLLRERKMGEPQNLSNVIDPS
jgi:hypothetical protein